jgi:hypothetical protein
MPTMKLHSNVLNVVVPSDHAQKLARIANDKGVSVSQLVNEVLAPLLGEDDEDDGRWVLLRIPEDAYKTYLEFFEGDMGFALQSMSAHIELGGDDFARALKIAGEM